MIGIDHGYAAIKTKNCMFAAGLTEYEHEPYTRQNVLEYAGRWYVCGTGRQPIQKGKTDSEAYQIFCLLPG